MEADAILYIEPLTNRSKTLFKEEFTTKARAIWSLTKSQKNLEEELTKTKRPDDSENNRSSNKSEESEGDETKDAGKGDVMYMRYDDSNMKFVYICTECSTVWKSADDT